MAEDAFKVFWLLVVFFEGHDPCLLADRVKGLEMCEIGKQGVAPVGLVVSEYVFGQKATRSLRCSFNTVGFFDDLGTKLPS